MDVSICNFLCDELCRPQHVRAQRGRCFDTLKIHFGFVPTMEAGIFARSGRRAIATQSP
jgi:hypothetical protein